MIVKTKMDELENANPFIVYAIYSRNSKKLYGIGNPYGEFLSLYPADEYVVVDTNTPSDWIESNQNDWRVLSFPEWSNHDDFLYWLQEGRQKELETFLAYKKKYTKQYLPILVSEKKKTLGQRYKNDKELARYNGYELPDAPNLDEVSYP